MMRASGSRHSYTVSVQWTGNLGTGTSAYTDYERAHTIQVKGKPTLLSSSDPSFRGDGNRYNPEELFIASLASCHMLWYLHLCAEANIIVTDYTDQAVGKMIDQGSKGGYFAEAALHPKVTIQPGVNSQLADELHDRAHQLCFIANSVNFPVHIQSMIIQA
jgi:organic hydroperoxide reductase OsmC/OhrA